MVSAVLLPGFENMTPTKKALAPKIEMSATDLNLGSFNGKKKLKGEILITNKGKSARMPALMFFMFSASREP